jgi:hypothetical protein
MKPNLALSFMRLGYSEALAGHFEAAARRLNEAVTLFDELGVTLWTPVAHSMVAIKHPNSTSCTGSRRWPVSRLRKAMPLERPRSGERPTRCSNGSDSRLSKRTARCVSDSDGGSWERGRAMTLQQAVDYALTEEVPTASDLPHDLGRPS